MLHKDELYLHDCTDIFKEFYNNYFFKKKKIIMVNSISIN